MSEIAKKLAELFPESEIEFKPQVFNQDKTSALAAAYIDARVVMDRLDEVLGPEGWEDEYELIPAMKQGGEVTSVKCTLRIKFGEQWVSKSDVGSTSEQPDPGDRLKAAFSDALKRCAVKFGVGRYLYSLPLNWAKYDQKSRFWAPPGPRLPDWAIPGKIKKKEEKKEPPDKVQRSKEVLENFINAKGKAKTVSALAELWAELNTMRDQLTPEDLATAEKSKNESKALLERKAS